MNTERALGLLHDWMVDHPKPPNVTVTVHLQACADAGDLEAQKVLRSGLYSAEGDAEVTPVPAPIVPRELERERRIAAQQVPAARKLNVREPRRPVVQTGHALWLK